MLKRAYWGVYGPNPIGTSYGNFFVRCWAPLMVRAFLDSLFFWACFTPQLLSGALQYMGWSTFSWVIADITQFAVCAAAFGYLVDSGMDTVIAAVGHKIPFLAGLIPQLPPPLPQKAVVEAAIVETHVTQLETTTTTIPKEAKL